MLIYPDNLEEKLGFDLIRDKLGDYCTTGIGKEKSREFSFSNDIEFIRLRLQETKEFVDIFRFDKGFDWQESPDLRSALKKAVVQGTFLDLQDFIAIRDNYNSIKKILAFFIKTKPDQYPALKAITKDIKTFPFIHDKLDKAINKQGKIRDNASSELSVIRRSIANKTNNLSRKLNKIVGKAQSDGWIDQDASPTIREGRLVIPVPATNKRKINGLVHDESATGKTVFIEPVELVELNNDIRALEIAENREIKKILIELTDSLRPYFDEILTWPEMIAELDFIRAKARLSMEWEGKEIIIDEGDDLDWKRVRHPILVLSYKKEKKKVIPQDIHLDKDNRILLISGPNAGGKSVCLMTVGLVQYIIQSGLLPPVDDGSVTRVFHQIFIDIGDEQSLENDLSTYSSHLLNMKNILRLAKPDSLILIDEFGTGTEPQLGAALAQAMLRQLNATGGYGVITTHYSNLKHFAAHEEGIVNGAMLYDAQHLEPLFQLEIGKPGSSFAFEIARKIGLPEIILEEARSEVGTDTVMFDKHLRDISRDKRYWEKKRKKIRLSEKRLEELIERYEEQIKEMEKERKLEIQNSRKNAQDILNRVNKKIENTIQEIRAHQAEKEKTRQARKSLESLKESVNRELSHQEDKLKEDISSKTKKHNEIKRITGIKPQRKADNKTAESNSDLVPGQKVRIKDRDTVGEVMKINSGSILLSIGQMITTMRAEDLEVISDKEFLSASGSKTTSHVSSSFYDLEHRRLKFSPNADVRGLRAKDAIEKIRELIDEAIMLGENNLRVLHGTGNGILRQVIREYLASHDIVAGYQDEDIRFGGSGITLIRLDF